MALGDTGQPRSSSFPPGIKLTSLDQVLSQLLAWMAILDHFEDAVSTIPRRISSSDDLRSLGHFAGRIWTSSIRQNS